MTFQDIDDQKRKEELKARIEIPIQIRDLRFIRVAHKDKIPIDKDWQNTANYAADDPIIQNHVKSQGNYGVKCGGGWIVIDGDTKEIQDKAKVLPKTFAVATSMKADGNRGMHYYYKCPGLDKKIILYHPTEKDEKGNPRHLGEIQTDGQQVIGPTCIHKSGIRYDVVENAPIADVSKEEVIKAFSEYIERPYVQLPEETGETFSILKVVDTSKLKKRGDEWYGAHPVHGSETGQNFWVNERKNAWHCFRCNTGGGPLSLIAVQEKILECKDVQKGVLCGDVWKKSVELGRKYGYIAGRKEDILVFEPHSAKQISETEYGPIEWLVDGMFPLGGTSILAGRSGAYKSWVLLLLAKCVARGEKFMGEFAVTKSNVLVLDQEMGEQLIKQRLQKLGAEDLENLFVASRTRLNFNDDKWCDLMSKFMKEHDITVIIADPFRRTHNIDEDSANEVSPFLTYQLEPFLKRNNCTLLMVHHYKKVQGGDKFQDDEQSLVRGSSEWGNYPHAIISLKKVRSIGEEEVKKIILTQLKNRTGIVDENPKLIEIKEEDGKMVFTWCGNAPEKISMEGAFLKEFEDYLVGQNLTEMKRVEIIEEFGTPTGRFSKSTITSGLARGVVDGNLSKPRKGFYGLASKGQQININKFVEEVI